MFDLTNVVGVGLGLDVAGHVVDEFAFLENHMNKAGRVLARPLCGKELERQLVCAQRVGLEQKNARCGNNPTRR